MKCWCTHLTLMYAFGWHELINGDVLPGTISFFATIWGQGTNAIMQLCSGCNKGWHTTCFQIPRGNGCVRQTNADVRIWSTRAYTQRRSSRIRFIDSDVGTRNQRNYATLQQLQWRMAYHMPSKSTEGMAGWGKQMLIYADADVRRCWCTHKMLMYAFDWHELINGDVCPVR